MTLKFKYLSGFGLVCLLLSICFPAFSQIRCLQNIDSQMQEQVTSWEKHYRTLDEDFTGFGDLNLPSMTYGHGKKLAILVHGYMGSPDEMSSIGAQLNAQNYHVYNMLIPGFAGTAKIANQYSYLSWIRWLNKEIQQAKECSQQILLIGFSTGGLLIHDWLMKNSNDPAIEGAVLVSPYFETSGVFRAVMQKTASKLVNQIGVGLVNAIPGFYDVGIMLKMPDVYMQSVPLVTSNQIVELGALNQTRRVVGGKIQTPTLLFLSEDDQITDPEYAKAVTERTLANRTLVEYGPKLKVRAPHHLMRREVSPVVDQLEAQILGFTQTL